MTLEIEKFTEGWDSLKTDKIVVVGRGKCASKYKYKSGILVFTINSALEFYPDAHATVIISAHYNELKDLPLFADATILRISRQYQQENHLIPGCTPSIFISFLLYKMKAGSTIYLQGFSMDEDFNKKYPSPQPRCRNYNWNRQVEAFSKCQQLATKKGINLILIDENSRLPFIKKGIPNEEDLDHG
jgi:hypothetical protein